MTPEAQRIAIAEACGLDKPFFTITIVAGFNKATEKWRIPDYLNDLNAMHEAEKELANDPNKDATYWLTLYKVLDGEFENGEPCDGPPHGHWCELKQVGHATAGDRAEAFLRTLGLWKEELVSEATVEGLR
jgi:hypothetical protein